MTRRPRRPTRRRGTPSVPNDITADNLDRLDRYEAIALQPEIVELFIAADILTAEEEAAGLLDDKGGEVVVTAAALRRLLDRLHASDIRVSRSTLHAVAALAADVGWPDDDSESSS